MTDFILYVCPVCGETKMCPNPGIYVPNLNHCHVDQNGQEYYIQMQMIYPVSTLQIKKDNDV